MLKNYFIIAARNLAKFKFFTSINVFCLALGMSLNLLFITLLTFLYTYDNFHSKKDNIYRIVTQVNDKKDNPIYASAPFGLISNLREDFTGIEKVVPIRNSLFGSASYLDKELSLNGYYADSEFLMTFDFPLVKGNPFSALSNPNTIVLSETLSSNIFGDKDPIGEVIKIEPNGEFLVTGIIKDVPANSHLQFEAIASLATLSSNSNPIFLEENWLDIMNSYIYILLPESINPSQIQDQLNRVAEERNILNNEFSASFELQPLNKIVPGPDMLNSIGPKWDYLSLTLIGLITLIILVPAAFNYINLSIAQSLNRMREIGVRKVVGGTKKQIFFQFIMETTLMMIIASVLSYFVFWMIRDDSMEYLGDESFLNLTPNYLSVTYFLVFTIILGFIAGFIPAIYFSKISPINSLKGKITKTNSGGFSMQKVVLVVQFVLSIGFIMAVTIIIQQYRYSVNYGFSFEQDNIVNIELQDINHQIFKNEFEKLSSISGISMSSHLLGVGSTPSENLTNLDLPDSIEAYYLSIDENFIPNVKLNLLAGNNFEDNPLKNSSLIIVNEEFVKEMNLSELSMAINSNLVLSDGREVIIGGVIENFHYSNLLKPIKSFFFKYDPDQFKYANINVTSREDFKDFSELEEIWDKIGEGKNINAQFFNHQIDDAYGFYFDIIKLWGFLGLLAITVACLGLLGFVVFTINNRLKEISIRKILGATSGSLLLLLSKDYMKIMILSSFIAIPITYLLFDNLLPSLQYYSLKIGFTEIFVSLLIVIILGLTTIFSQTLKAANSNPVDNLKSE